MSEFTVVFDVEEENPPSGWATYRRFIENLRRQLTGGRYSHNLPVLPVEEEYPTRWFDIVLRTNNHRITLTNRGDNLYLVGYRMENSDQWLEFGSDTDVPRPPHLIPGSSFLGFGGGYGQLAVAAGRPRGSDTIPQGRGDIPLGQQPLINAVNELATSTTRRVRARQLTIVIQMINESIRFDRITNYLATTFVTTPSLLQLPPAPAWMEALENGWEQLSEALLRADASPDYRPFPLPTNNMNIVTAEQAVFVLAMLKGYNFPPRPSLSLGSRAPRTAAGCSQGKPLVEVFSVRVSDKEDGPAGDRYGTITVTDALSSQHIYNRKRGDYESIRPRDTALLTGPARSISALGSFTINVFLVDMDSDWSWDDEVSCPEISWNVFETTTNVYDKLLSDTVDGRYASVTVNYVVFSDAAQATVEVTLIRGSDGGNTADVYGQLAARNTNFSNQSVLFRRSSDEDIGVSPGQRIPLSRSVVAVPLNSSLIVQAGLSDDEIAKGTADFPAQLSGTFQKNIPGKYGEIRVKVIWTS